MATAEELRQLRQWYGGTRMFHPGRGLTGGGGTTSGGGGTSGGQLSAPPTGLTSEQKSAQALIDSVLSEYGLESLGAQAWGWYLNGATVDQVFLDIRKTPEYAARFPAMAELSKQGRAISEQTYIDYERQAAQVMQRYGLPAGFSDGPEDFAALIGGNVSIAELDRRIQIRTEIAYNTDEETLRVLRDDYGATPGHVLAYVIDPKNALPLIERDFLAAKIGGAAGRTGYDTDKAMNERLATLGVTAEQAQEGFGALEANRALFVGLPGTSEDEISQEEQIGATFEGDAAANQKIMRRKGQRLADFTGGGQFLGGESGVTGIGSARGA